MGKFEIVCKTSRRGLVEELNTMHQDRNLNPNGAGGIFEKKLAYGTEWCALVFNKEEK